MDLRKYSVSEFSEMLENEMKLNKEKCEKIAKYYEMKRDIILQLSFGNLRHFKRHFLMNLIYCKHYRKKDFYYVSNKKKFLSQIQIRISD